MLRRIDTLYKERPTLAELYAEDAQLFSGLSNNLPTNDSPPTYGLTEFVSLALVELGDLQTIFPNAATLKAFLATWSKLHSANWSRMQNALNNAYNPIHNYDRTEEESETVTGSGSASGTGSSNESGSEMRSDYRAGFNSAAAAGAAVPTSKEIVQPGRSSATASSTSTSSETGRERELHVSGNLGVTTSQQMVTAELELRDKFVLYYMILDEFRREIGVEVW